MKKTVIVFYSKGYCDQVAQALGEYYATIADQASCLLIDEKQYTFGSTRAFKDSMYRLSMRNFPSINRFAGYISYQYNEKFKSKTSKNAIEAEAQEPTEKPNDKEESFRNLKIRFRKMDNILIRFNPDIVVCTTPISLEKALKARERLSSPVQICVAITDYCTNRGMINKGVDKYLVQNANIKQTLIAFGIAEKNIEVLGTPIPKGITEKFDKAKVLDEFGVKNKELPNVMLVSGRCGCARVIDAFKDLAPLVDEMNLFVFENNSQNIKSFIKSYAKAAKISENIYVIDEIDNMAKIYSIVDVIVSSPTAAITYEASAREIPCVLLKPANLLEEGNFTFLTSHGYSYLGEKTSHLVPAVLSLLKGQNIDGTPVVVRPQPVDRAKPIGDYILSLIKEEAQEKKAQKSAARKARLEKEAQQAQEDEVKEETKKSSKKKK